VVPTGIVKPVIDGRLTRYYEWHGAGSWELGTGGSAMHRVSAPIASGLRYGFDSTPSTAGGLRDGEAPERT